MSNPPKEGYVFVTVGTTSFDSLVEVIDSQECRKMLIERGYTSLLIQLGRGNYIPQTSDKDEDLKVEFFRFAPDIAKHLSSASLVISHAGSGSIFETLHCLKPLVVVVNEALMDNHQFELAEELARKKHLYCATTKTLVQTLKNMDLESLVPYKAGDAKKLVRSLNHFLGFED